MPGERKTMGPEIVITLMVLSAAAIIIWALFLRYKRQEMRHKERMTALEKGALSVMSPEQQMPPPRARSWLKCCRPTWCPPVWFRSTRCR